MKTKNLSIVATILLAVALVATYYFKTRHTNTPENSTVSAETVNNTVPVTAIIVQEGTLIQHISASGYIKAIKKVVLTSQVSGQIEKLFIKDGDYVKKTDLLCLVDSLPYKLEYEKCRSALLKALGEFIPELKIRNSTYLPEWESFFQSILTSYPIPPMPIKTRKISSNSISALMTNTSSTSDSARISEYLIIARYNIPPLYAELKNAEKYLEACRIKAPFSGYVSNLKVVTGALLSPNQPLLTLTNLDTVKVEIEVLEDDMEYVTTGKKFGILANHGEKITGTIYGVDPGIDKEKRIGKAYALIPNSRHRFKDGQFVQVRLVKQILPNRLLVPVKAVLNRNDRDLVFKVQNNLAKWQYVTLGQRNETMIEVLSGLSENDTVIVEGHYSLAHDSKVKVKLIR